MGTTPTWGLRYPEATDPADVPLDLRELAEDVDTKIGTPLDTRLDAIEAAPSGISLIEAKTLAAPGTLSFTAIPQTYAHLRVVARTRGTFAGATDQIYMRLNGSQASYFWQRLWGAGAAASADSGTDVAQASVGSQPAATDGANKWAALVLEIPGYRMGQWASWIAQCWSGQSAGGWAFLCSGVWANVAPITQLDLFGSAAANLAIGSRASLYGLK